MLDALSRLASLCSNGQITDPFMVPWWALDYARTSAVRAVLAERYEPATVAKYLSALRGVLKDNTGRSAFQGAPADRITLEEAYLAFVINQGRELDESDLQELGVH